MFSRLHRTGGLCRHLHQARVHHRKRCYLHAQYRVSDGPCAVTISRPMQATRLFTWWNVRTRRIQKVDMHVAGDKLALVNCHDSMEQLIMERTAAHGLVLASTRFADVGVVRSQTRFADGLC
jgi:hypothetical protein